MFTKQIFPSVCFWVWRCGNGSAVTGFLRSGAAGAQRLVRWSKPRRAPPLAEAALGPFPSTERRSLLAVGRGPRRGRGGGGPRARKCVRSTARKGPQATFLSAHPPDMHHTAYQLLEVWQRLCRYRLPTPRSCGRSAAS